MSGLYREEPPEEGSSAFGLGEFRVEVGYVGTEGCWVNLVATSSFEMVNRYLSCVSLV